MKFKNDRQRKAVMSQYGNKVVRTTNKKTTIRKKSKADQNFKSLLTPNLDRRWYVDSESKNNIVLVDKSYQKYKPTSSNKGFKEFWNQRNYILIRKNNTNKSSYMSKYVVYTSEDVRSRSFNNDSDLKNYLKQKRFS